MNMSSVTDAFVGMFFKFLEQLSFFKEQLPMNASSFTAVIAFRFHSVSKVLCVQKYSPNRRKPKKTYSSIQRTQADQLNETNYQLAFRLASKYLRVENHSK